MSLTWAKNSLPTPLRRYLRTARQAGGKARQHPGFVLSTMPLIGELVAAARPARHPPVLVASLPRSGSSWIGRILGSSEDSLYLREPMTQGYLEHMEGRQSPFFEWRACMEPGLYRRLATRAFAGIPCLEAKIVPFPAQWGMATRTSKRVVVKETNPLTLDWFWQCFQPRIILLVRHPVPVTRSFKDLGWTTRDQFSTRFTPETLARFEAKAPIPRQADIWVQGGAFQAITQNLAIEQLRDIEHLVVRYEDVCRDPLAQFERIFAFCGLPFSTAIREEIMRSSGRRGDYRPGRYDTVRNSIEMAERWKTEIAAAEIERVRGSYLAYDPAFYRDDKDWTEAAGR
jgi:hypothetical protein